ncbi:sigma-54 interaction domain-containing protein [Clostridiisalibacter paucivorans]|uniref:sigma-54 interaction domain-containing protein n=1 Tax=Clostridiisalibacter paucivorans TaxID=408753 RepID=UPI00047DB64E|nr:sigma 54-interacting transcriptional regulator [Clostridiisalibacter paucivorans]
MEKDLLLDLINDSISEGVHVIDEYGKTLVYNQTMAELEGLTVNEVIDKNLLDVLPSLKNESTLLKVLETGQPIIEKVQTYFNKEGKQITTLNSTFPITQQSKVIGAIEVAKDISKIKKLKEQALFLENSVEQDESEKNKRNIYRFEDIIGYSPQILNAKQIARMASKTFSNVLIIGESGTGKELFAQSIHSASNRKDKPFVAENCAALPETLLEGLLFGTSKGGFTGAIDRPGLFQQADGGTLMLDEINSMPLNLQVKLLRAIQEGKFRPIGSESEQHVDVRIIAVTNEDPVKSIKKGKLRKDLFYRLSVVNLFIPPLREREGDIDILTDYFIEKLSKKMDKRVGGLDDSVKDFFHKYSWPGNVRELEHLLEGAINLIESNEKITVEHLPYHLKRNISNQFDIDSLKTKKVNICKYEKIKKGEIDLSTYLKEVEEEVVREALKETDGNISKAAAILGISRQSLQYKIKSKLF